MKIFTRIVLLMAAMAFVAARSAQAQTVGLADDSRTGLVSAGAYVGLEFDDPDHALLLGGDGRIRFGQSNLEINPRFTFRPFNDGSMQQIDVNFLTNYRLANPGRFRPYSGIGIGIHRLSYDAGESSSDVGLNLVTGVRLAMRPGAAYEPFLGAQYTIMKEPGNSFTLVVGTSFSFR
jgi:opacity protein-like surface antigen